jgi:hypothetical protein
MRSDVFADKGTRLGMMQNDFISGVTIKNEISTISRLIPFAHRRKVVRRKRLLANNIL